MKNIKCRCDQCGRSRICKVKHTEYLYDRVRYELRCPGGHIIHTTQYKQIKLRGGQLECQP